MSEPLRPEDDVVNEVLSQSRTKDSFGPLFDQLIEIVNEELNVQFAMGGFGRELPDPEPDSVLIAAVMIADGIDEAFMLQPRDSAHPAPELSAERKAQLAQIKSRICVYRPTPEE
jgi:hypothetical protein